MSHEFSLIPPEIQLRITVTMANYEQDRKFTVSLLWPESLATTVENPDVAMVIHRVLSHLLPQLREGLTGMGSL